MDKQLQYLDSVVQKFGHRVFAKFNSDIDSDNIYIGRGSIFGNPFRMKTEGDRTEVCMKYRRYLFNRVTTEPDFATQVKALKGKNVVCFCSNGTNSVLDGAKYCHGHILLACSEWLNSL